jgi:hypothetical protein
VGRTNGLLVSDHSMTSFITEWDLAVDAADHAIVVTNDTRSGADWDIFRPTASARRGTSSGARTA